MNWRMPGSSIRREFDMDILAAESAGTPSGIGAAGSGAAIQNQTGHEEEES
jgi:hypothetical protein